MRRFLVSCSDEGVAARAHRVALASLPDRFRLVNGGHADVAVSTSSAELPGGVRAAVITDPGAARAAAIPIFPAWVFLPRLETDACFLAARDDDIALIVLTTTVARAGAMGMRATLLEQLAVLRCLTGLDPVIAAVTCTETGYTASVDLGAAIVALAAVTSPFGRDTLRLNAVGRTGRLDVVMDADATARPASIRLFGRGGVREAMPVHQSSHRLTWCKVHALLGDPDTVSSTTTVVDHDLICASQWLGAL